MVSTRFLSCSLNRRALERGEVVQVIRCNGRFPNHKTVSVDTQGDVVFDLVTQGVNAMEGVCKVRSKSESMFISQSQVLDANANGERKVIQYCF